MAWIESHQSLARHRKTLRAAGRLSVDRATLIGHLHFLWWWGLDNVGADGRLGDMTAYEIAAAAEWPGDPEQFLAALIEAGFIDETPDGLVLHDWYDYAGKFIDRREAERERSRQRRANKRAQESRPAGDHATTDGRPRNDQRSTVGTVPNLTVPNLTVPRDRVDANASTPDGQDDAPTAKGQIAELVATYREACNATPLQRDYAFMGRLYNSYPIDQIYAAIDQAALQIAAGQQLEDPLRYIAGVLRNTNSPARASPGGRQTRETPIDRKLRALGVI